MRDTLREAMTTTEKGPKVIVAASECMLNRQRRERPQENRAIARGQRVSCARGSASMRTPAPAIIPASGCPAVPRSPSVRTRTRCGTIPIAHVDNSCVGCGLCGEVAHAAVLCPSFYRAQLVFNPTRWDRLLAALRGAIIGFLQRLAETRRARHAY